MFQPGTDWNPLQAQLRAIIRKPERFEETIALCKDMHARLHLADMAEIPGPTLADEVCAGLAPDDWAVMPTKRDVTVAWNLWHIVRIEDITMNLLVADGEQVLDGVWQSAMNVSVTDTGNAMSDEEILALSGTLNLEQFLLYRNAVGRRSRAILDALVPGDMKRKFTPEQVGRILPKGGLTEAPDSIWLRDFWGRKDVAGILLLPLTRHQVGHLNDCLKLKQKIAGKKK